MTGQIGRREFITLLGGTAGWPLVARAQQPAMPVIAFITGGSPDSSARLVAAFRKGLNESGTIEGQNVTVEYHWLESPYDRLPALIADLVRRQPRPPRRQRDRHIFFHNRDYGQAAAAPA